MTEDTEFYAADITDPEIRAIFMVAEALDELPEMRARARVLRWALDRYVPKQAVPEE